MTTLNGPRSRVVLIGTGHCAEDSELPAVPAVETTIADLRRALIDRCGVDDTRIKVVLNPPTPMDFGSALAEQADQAEEVLLVYYIGHGLVSPGGELYLATCVSDDRPSRRAHTSLAYAAFRDSLLESPARSIVVVLDCCFSGRAIGVLGSSGDASDLAHVHGGYVLTSSAENEFALAPEGARHTAFTGELIRLLTEGDPLGPPMLTVRYAYQFLCRVFQTQGFPLPHQRASESIEDLELAPNPAYVPDDPAQEPDGPGQDVCPYPGLAPFKPDQQQWFFGRERLIRELAYRLADRMNEADPLLVVGPSGAGKSSLLGAGLAAALDAGLFPRPGARTWPRVLVTPKDQPVRNLAIQLASPAGTTPDTLCRELLRDPRSLASTIRRVLRSLAGDHPITGARMILVVDQFEEVFTQTEQAERNAFIHALSTVAGGVDGEPPALVILGVRADFYRHCVAYPELRPALQRGQIIVGPMTMTEVRDAIERPAHRAGLILQPGLIDILLNDLGVTEGMEVPDPEHPVGDARTLPLLAHALEVTWQQRAVHTLTIAGYQIVGGIQDAIATTAEGVYGRFDSSEQDIARRLLLRMVNLRANTDAARVRRDMIRLVEGIQDSGKATGVLYKLAEARLVTLDEASAEITHDALLGAWPRLEKWIEEEREGYRVRQRLAEAARVWHELGRQPQNLYRDAPLSLAREWSADPDHVADLTTMERAFLDDSIAADIKRLQAGERRLRSGYIAAGLAIALAVITAVFAYTVIPWGHPGVTNVDGENIGVTDGSFVFDPSLGMVEADIRNENNAIAGQPEVTVALLMPMTTRGDLLSVQQIRSHVEGAYIEQEEANSSPTGPKIRLVLANEGSNEQDWQRVTNQLGGMLGGEAPLVAVTGLGVSIRETAQGARALSRMGLPMVGSVFNADGLDTAGNGPGVGGRPINGLVRVDPSNTEEVAALNAYLSDNQDAAMLVYDSDPDDLYTSDLRTQFQEQPATKAALQRSGSLEALFDAVPNSTELDDQFQTIANLLCARNPRIIFYAGRAELLPDFLNRLGRRSCAQRPVTVVTGSDATELQDEDVLKPDSGPDDVSVLYAAPADPEALRDLPSPSVDEFVRFQQEFVGKGFPVSDLNNGWATLAHDAMQATIQAIRTAAGQTHPLPTRQEVLNALEKIRGANSVPGASGTFTFNSEGERVGLGPAVLELLPNGSVELLALGQQVDGE